MAFHTITLINKEEVADGTMMFSFTKPEGFVFTAGQYIAMKLPRLIEEDRRGPARSLSIATAPSERTIGFGMRNTQSGFKKTLWSMEPGETVDITDAIGSFTVDPKDTRTIVFLAGGIGITPVRSILKEMEAQRSEQEFVLLHANRGTKDAPFYEEIKNFHIPHLMVAHVLSDTENLPDEPHHELGFITKECLEKYVDKTKESVYYIVGSPQFIQAMQDLLLSLGVKEDHWKVDSFTGLISQSIEK